MSPQTANIGTMHHNYDADDTGCNPGISFGVGSTNFDIPPGKHCSLSSLKIDLPGYIVAVAPLGGPIFTDNTGVFDLTNYNDQGTGVNAMCDFIPAYKKLPQTISGTVSIPLYLRTIVWASQKAVQSWVNACTPASGSTANSALTCVATGVPTMLAPTRALVKSMISDTITSFEKTNKLTSQEGSCLVDAINTGSLDFKINSFIFNPGSIISAGLTANFKYSVSKQ